MIKWQVLQGGLQPLCHGDSLDFQPHAEPQRSGFWLQYFWSTLTLWFSMKVFPGWALRSQRHADSFHTALLYVPSKAFLLLNLLVTGFFDEATHRSCIGFLVYKKSVGEVFILYSLWQNSLGHNSMIMMSVFSWCSCPFKYLVASQVHFKDKLFLS